MIDNIYFYLQSYFLLMTNLPYIFFIFICESLINFSWLDFYSFLWLNNHILILLFVCLGILMDRRFPWKNKIFIYVYYLSIVLCFILFSHTDSIFIQELFWYTLALNTAFIFHICLLDWLYQYFIWRNNDYGCFLVTRLSFICSLTFIVYLLNFLYVNKYKVSLLFSDKNIYRFYRLIYGLLNILIMILLFFIRLFSEYSATLLGIRKVKLSFRSLIIYVIYFSLTLIVSSLILGVPRIYFLWIIILISNIRIHCFHSRLKQMDYYIVEYTEIIIDNIYVPNLRRMFEKINSKGFSYAFIEFLNYSQTLHRNAEEWPIKCPFIYYRKDYLMMIVIRARFKLYIQQERYITMSEVETYLSILDNELIIDKKLAREKIVKIYKKLIKDQ